uniref:Uncharacterized protein n=1 Tax=Glossina palpalis gambiensis TaxID=67801 RepID=A0A1B0BFR6_9MUSC
MQMTGIPGTGVSPKSISLTTTRLSTLVSRCVCIFRAFNNIFMYYLVCCKGWGRWGGGNGKKHSTVLVGIDNYGKHNIIEVQPPIALFNGLCVGCFRNELSIKINKKLKLVQPTYVFRCLSCFSVVLLHDLNLVKILLIILNILWKIVCFYQTRTMERV